MKKFAERSLLFILFFVFFFVLINFLFLGVIAVSDWDFRKRLESLKFTNPDFELLVLGTSLAEYGIDTELITSKGIKSFNLALVGSSVRTNYIQLNEYLLKYTKRPQYVLIVLNSNLEQFDQEGIQPIVAFTNKDYEYGLKDAPVLKFKWLGVEMLKKILSTDYRKTGVSHGQVKFKITNSDNTNLKELYLSIQKFESAYWIGELAKLCDQNSIELIVIEMPGFRETQNLSEIGPYRLSFNNGHSAVLYNFNNQNFCKMFDANKDWVGESHFNETGAQKFAEQLLIRIFNK